MVDSNSFDKLVSGLSGDERKAMLSKMKTEVADEVVFNAVEVYDKNARLDFSDKLKRESLITRFLIWIKSICTGSSPVTLYNEHLIAGMVKGVLHNYPSLIDAKRELLLEEFYQKLVQLRICANFFKRYVSLCEEDVNDFYVFLGSLIVPSVETKMEEEVNPFSLSLDKEITSDLRTSLLRKQEEVFASIAQNKKDEMYEAVRGYEWLRGFCRMPFDTFIVKFSSINGGPSVCSFGQIGQKTDIVPFTRILCNTRPLPNVLLKAMYLFSMKNRITQNLEELDNQDTPETFMQQATNQVAMIKMFVSSVPSRTISCIILKDAAWIPETIGGGEDWFVKYKNQWKRIFDQQWKSWTVESKKEKLKVKLEDYFNMPNYPLLPNRPWATLKGCPPYRYELTLGFLYYFITERYVKAYIPVLKIIVLEGEFVKKDTQTEFTDVSNVFEEVVKGLKDMTDSLSPLGDWGADFVQLAESRLRTPQGEARLEQMVEQIDITSTMLLQKFGQASRTMASILKGLQGDKVSINYGSLSNLTSIQGGDNEKFRKNLQGVVSGLTHAIEMVKELEPLDAPLT